MGGSKEVREATSADIPQLLVMGQSFFEASPWPAYVEFDVERLSKTLSRLLESEDAIILMTDHGMMAAVIYDLYPAACSVAQELFWWSEDGTGTDLRRAMETKAKAKGAKLCVLSAVENDQMVTMDRAYRMWGYRLVERLYVREL
jgi:sulfur transfer complex TusBCD TusB component (DsrH family)